MQREKFRGGCAMCWVSLDLPCSGRAGTRSTEARRPSGGYTCRAGRTGGASYSSHYGTPLGASPRRF